MHGHGKRIMHASIIGSGLLATAFQGVAEHLGNACIYAAGVSNSGCSDLREFAREQERLLAALDRQPAETLFIYFSTCSIDDSSARTSPYVAHKINMESIVAARGRYLVFRLPQVAGTTPNPHTLLNYLFARIIRSERFEIWGGATRNIIDVNDIVHIAIDLIRTEHACNETINIANTRRYSMPELVTTMGRVLGHTPIYDVVDKGHSYHIDVSRISAALKRQHLVFNDNYLEQVIQKYYGQWRD